MRWRIYRQSVRARDGVCSAQMSLSRAAWLLAALLLAAGPALAGPPRGGREVYVIPAEREADARELLAAVVAETPPELQWRGPSIEVDRIKWWLMQGDQARALLLLSPASAQTSEDELGPPDARSKSFLVHVAWAPELEPTPAEREAMDAALAAVVAGDQGGFYTIAVDAMYAEMLGETHEEQRAAGNTDVPELVHYNLAPSEDPERVRRRWATRTGWGLLLVLLALGNTLLRPEPKQPSAPAS